MCLRCVTKFQNRTNIRLTGIFIYTMCLKSWKLLWNIVVVDLNNTFPFLNLCCLWFYFVSRLAHYSNQAAVLDDWSIGVRFSMATEVSLFAFAFRLAPGPPILRSDRYWEWGGRGVMVTSHLRVVLKVNNDWIYSCRRRPRHTMAVVAVSRPSRWSDF
jgi:hypothetical protein